MLLVVDVGNTNTVLGVYQGTELVAHWRVSTQSHKTADEYAMELRQLLALHGLDWSGLDAAILSTVVPAVQYPLEQMAKQFLGTMPLIVGPGIKTGMPILYEPPRDVGADRIVNAVAAFEKFQGSCIVVDFGTATTFDVVTAKGEYLGGVIAPGVMISADALYEHAAKLPRVELARPARVIGRNTVASIQSGIVYGYAGLVDNIVERMKAELDQPTKVVATGGIAPLMTRESRTIQGHDEMLTLRGLRILFERNTKA